VAIEAGVQVLVDINAGVAADADAAVAADANLRLMGLGWRESHGTPAAAAFNVVNGATGAADGKVFPVEVAANASSWAWFGPQGIPCPLGISIDWIAGLVDVYLYYAIVG
jgi:hypothetical protein